MPLWWLVALLAMPMTCTIIESFSLCAWDGIKTKKFFLSFAATNEVSLRAILLDGGMDCVCNVWDMGEAHLW